ncbi:MAG: hypothetical protein PHG48_04160, partial [Eubacteriales bacterium]|nr:hypothetical protein [Eubacteriales bacterium]
MDWRRALYIFRICIISAFTIFITSGILTACMAKEMAIMTESADYYVSNEGNDDNDGRSPGSPWRSLAKVNNYNFLPGDTVRFKRGDTWRGQLLPKSGSEAGLIWYTSYGCGKKPVIMGSVSKGSVSGWVCEGENIWVSKPEIEWESDIELLSFNSSGRDGAGWRLYNNTASAAYSALSECTGRYEGGSCIMVEIAGSGSKESDIQLSMGDVVLEAGKTYKLTFAARSTEDVTISSVKLVKSAAPFGKCSDTVVSMRLTEDWTEYEYFFNCGITEPDAKICFYLGNLSGNGAALFFDRISFKECVVSGLIDTDTGNL